MVIEVLSPTDSTAEMIKKTQNYLSAATSVVYIMDPKTNEDAVKIMAARVGIPAEEYKTFIKGTKILTLEEARGFFKKGEGYTSLYGSSKISDDFNVANKVYEAAQDVDSYIDPSLTNAM